MFKQALYPPTEPLKLSRISKSNLEATDFMKPVDTNDKMLKGLNNLLNRIITQLFIYKW